MNSLLEFAAHRLLSGAPTRDQARRKAGFGFVGWFRSRLATGPSDAWRLFHTSASEATAPRQCSERRFGGNTAPGHATNLSSSASARRH